MFALLARNGESLDLFHRAAKLSGSRYDLGLNGKWPELPQLAQFPEGGKLLAGQAVLVCDYAGQPVHRSARYERLIASDLEGPAVRRAARHEGEAHV